MKWWAITRRRAGGVDEFYSVATAMWWKNAGESTQYRTAAAAKEAIEDLGLVADPVEVEEQLEEEGPDPADAWKRQA